jgi:uncharacterized protein YgfB (UPF0149 family)
MGSAAPVDGLSEVSGRRRHEAIFFSILPEPFGSNLFDRSAALAGWTKKFLTSSIISDYSDTTDISE